ncbi:MAG: hypothetical protein FWB85_04665 [Chitinispirillia bacterium]|nr:hypothetical protein [Chitinispirillia bacterium]MCL2241611.1 hypothetical protein [Chitinispirillia bacterium]
MNRTSVNTRSKNTYGRVSSSRSVSGSGILNKTRVRGGDAQPVLRLRTMFIGLCVLVACIAGPLGLVWKQSYINQASIRLEANTEALRLLNVEIKSLNLACHRLAEPERVERIARSQGFEYPLSRQLEVLEVRLPRQERGIGGFFARVMRSLSGES